jgi:RNA polymerase sigma factor (sigma-70 family)
MGGTSRPAYPALPRCRADFTGLPPRIEAAARRTARRYSLCADDADDAFQRAVEILLTRQPEARPHCLGPWMNVVVRREALSLRRARQRACGHLSPAALDSLAFEGGDPAELYERHERIVAGLRALSRLKPAEQRALVLQAQGHSYAEIGRICGWTYTKVNRSLAEGRARLRELRALQD